MKRISRFFKNIDYKSIFIVYLLSFVLTIVVECIARSSFASFFTFAFDRFHIFAYNILILSLFFAVCRLFGKRTFAMTLIGAIWLTLAVVNAILVSMRPSPLTAFDFIVFLSAYGITDNYLKLWELVLLIFAAIALIAFLVFIYLNTERKKINFRKEILSVCIVVLVFTSVTFLGRMLGSLDIDFKKIKEAYRDNGFVYCFCDTLVGSGIKMPFGYSSAWVGKIVSELPEETSKEDVGELPNIIFVQLESFFDINYYNDYKASENAIPNFTKLKKEYPSGILNVPVFGGGTANTEFEILTGMNIDRFGGGEIPYNSIIKEKTCETLPFLLKNYDYSACAIHNHDATFYERHKIYGNLGFDYFIPIEYMQNVKRTKVGWAKDEMLTDNIFDALNNTSGKDFIFAVSVQGHGGYPKEDEDFDLPITLANDDNSQKAFGVRYYINMLHEMDKFVGELVERLEAFDEKTIVVFYGDHLPALDLTEKNLSVINTFQTEYIVYSNFDFEFDAREIEAFQLGSDVVSAVGLSCGNVMRVNQNREALGNDYDSYHYNLQYDLLYGEGFSQPVPFESVDMSFGVKEITIDKVVFYGGDLRVDCTNSTFESVIFVNDKEMNTKYIDENKLLCDSLSELKNSDVITVRQVSHNGTVLGSSAPYIEK